MPARIRHDIQFVELDQINGELRVTGEDDVRDASLGSPVAR